MPRLAKVNIRRIGPSSWEVNTAALTPRYRKCWPSIAEAETDAERIRRQLAGTGLRADDLREYESAAHRLATTDLPGRGKSVAFAVDFFLANYAGDTSSRLIFDWVTDYKALKHAVVEAKTYIEIDQYLNHLCAAGFGGLTASQVTDEALRLHLKENSAPWHRDKVLRNFFNWLAGKECKRLTVLKTAPLKISPFAYIKKPAYTRVSADVHALHMDKIRASIELAIKSHPDALGQFVFGVLTGARPDCEAPDFWTLPHLGWSKIDLKRRLLTIPREVEKTGKRNRQLVLPPNVVAWMEYFKAKGTPMVCPRRAWRQFKAEAYPEFQRVQDLLRHTAVSHYARRLSMSDLEIQFATSQDMIVNHYLSMIADDAEIEWFFTMVPADFGLV